MSKPIVALMYDFDKTLALSDMQSFEFIPKLGLTADEFWAKTSEFCEKYDTDRVLGYLYTMILVAKEKGIKITKEYLRDCGKNIKFFDGVSTRFQRINEYAESKGLQVEHYLITSGNKEIVEGNPICKEFKQVFGCEFVYDKDGVACWPKSIINYTLKTQYIFRISKGAIYNNDDTKVNEKTLQKRIKYQNMIYFGDGMTDVPCMILVKENGGTSIAVHPKGEFEKVANLYEGNRVNFIAKADYKNGSELDRIVKLIIDGIAIREALVIKQEKIEKKL